MNRLLTVQEVALVQIDNAVAKLAALPYLFDWAKGEIAKQMRRGQTEVVLSENDFRSARLKYQVQYNKITVELHEFDEFLPLLAKHINENGEWRASFRLTGIVTLTPKKEPLWRRIKRWFTNA